MDVTVVYRFADRRFGVVTRQELSRCGISNRRITRLVRVGLLIRVHRAVYRLPGSPQSIQHVGLAACLAVGEHAVASHLTAGRLWNLTDRVDSKPDVTIPWDHRCLLPTVRIHRSVLLDRREVTRTGPIPVTRVARTVSDLATVLGEEDLEDALDEALRRRLVTPQQLAQYPRIRKLAEDRLKHGTPESRLERRAIAALRRAGLPEPVRQYEVRIRGKTYRPDLSYPARKTAIELEGEAPHWGKTRWQYDHERDRAFELAGWRVLTYTWDDANEGSYRFVMEVGEILGLRPTRWTDAAR